MNARVSRSRFRATGISVSYPLVAIAFVPLILAETYNWSDGIPFVVEMKKKMIVTPKKKIVPRKKAVTH